MVENVEMLVVGICSNHLLDPTLTLVVCDEDGQIIDFFHSSKFFRKLELYMVTNSDKNKVFC